MPKFLIVYSKSREKSLVSISMVIEKFRQKNAREFLDFEASGFLLSTERKYAQSVFEDGDTISFVSGHISYEKARVETFYPPAESWRNFISLPDSNPAHLEGMFAAFHYDKQKHELTYVNDKFGIFPVFVYEDSEFLLLSNDYQSLASYDNKADSAAIAEFFTFGVTLGNKTFFRNIKSTDPATIVKIEGQRIEQSNYWKAPAGPEVDSDIDWLAAEVYQTFTKINREYHEAGFVKICLLTAGADSRLIISTLTQSQRLETLFYTSNLSFLDPLQDQDVVGASAITTKYNLNHSVEKISFYENSFDEGYFENEREVRDEQVYGGWHGGELLGGYCFLAAPINRILNYDEVDSIYRSVFNWWFRFRHKEHPFAAYKRELEKCRGNELLFLIREITSSFFTGIYGGTRGHWVQPFQLVNHGISPFWDSRMLRLLLKVPPDELKNYSFYNRVLKYADKEFTCFPSNSPLTHREDSVLPKFDLGSDPKLHIPDTHHKAYTSALENFQKSRLSFYNKRSMKEQIKSKDHPLTRRWLDFEVWSAKYLR